MSSIVVEPKTPKINSTIPKNTIFTTTPQPKWPPQLQPQPPSSSRRTPSLSSSPSQSSNSSSSFRSFTHEEDYSSPPPTPPQRIPFSWESIPGIPKHQILKRLDSNSSSSTTTTTKTSSKYLPLPPAASITTKPTSYYKKHHIIRTNDPFFAALVECSKGGVEDEDEDEEEDHKSVFGSSLWKYPAKSLSHRFGFVNFSCKNTCSSVAESLVFLPREQPRRISYGLVKKR